MREYDKVLKKEKSKKDKLVGESLENVEFLMI